jgi:hypothetical protein
VLSLLLAAISAINYSRQPAKSSTLSNHRIAKLPRLILWAWERPENLSFIDPVKIGVAFLAKTILLRNNDMVVKPRLQPLATRPGTALIAVVRIETDRNQIPTFNLEQRKRLVFEISTLAKATHIAAIQIDFDATTSERAFYRELLIDLRQQLPSQTALSITALASWAFYDNWIEDLPIDEAVPMLFRMGADHHQITSYLEAGKEFKPAVCRDSLGISLDQPLPKLPSGRRVYVFNPQSWSAAAVENIVKKVDEL